MTETDKEFLDRYWEYLNWDTEDPDFDRLFALARRGAEMQWRPIETAPKDGRWLMVSAERWEPETACWSESVWLTGWYCGGGRSDSYGPSFEPTHWMPLPTPPSGEQSNE